MENLMCLWFIAKTFQQFSRDMHGFVVAEQHDFDLFAGLFFYLLSYFAFYRKKHAAVFHREKVIAFYLHIIYQSFYTYMSPGFSFCFRNFRNHDIGPATLARVFLHFV